MKHKWLALALIVLAALGAFGVAFTSGHDPLVYATGAVIAATDEAAVNRAVAAAANTRRIFANVVDDAELSSFHVPAIVQRGPAKLRMLLAASSSSPSAQK